MFKCSKPYFTLCAIIEPFEFVLNFVFWSFDIVLNFVLRISNFPSLDHSFKTEKRKGHESGRNQSNGNILQRPGHPSYDDSLAYPGKQDQGKAKTGRVGYGGNKHLQKIVLFLDIDQTHTHDRTVGRNQGEKDTQAGVKGRDGLLHEGFHELDQRGDDQDEYNSPNILKA